ncbi:MAG: FHA domain-containing protein [Anaerolineae bacterium]|nr:FHA domain-containing protein [Anaerolineae bacterium]RIK21307.1 MAG: hypothetical protein DCC51_06390 [Anaerolineae bacterium]
MNLPLLLIIIRFVSAAALLSFLGIIFWYLHRDLRSSRLLSDGESAAIGMIRILTSSIPDLAMDTVLDLSPITSIGRNDRNTIVLDDNYVSGEHALLSWRESQWWLEDLNSRNGTLLNDVAISDPVVVSAGDIITVGGVRMKLEQSGRQPADEPLSGIRDSNP